jgi:quinol monooxygenase YgiN
LKNIVIIANIKVKEEFKDEVYDELLKLYKSTHSFDEGFIQYELHKDLDEESCFIFIETWQSAELLALHEQKEHFKTFVLKIENKIESLEIKRLEKIII